MREEEGSIDGVSRHQDRPGPSDPALFDKTTLRGKAGNSLLAKKARHAAWMMGDPRQLLRNDQLPWLQAIWDAQQRGAGEFCLYLGRQNGKTHFIRYAAIRDFLSGTTDPATGQHVPGNVAVVSKSQRSTKDIAKDIFDMAFRSAPKVLGIRWIAHENRYVNSAGGSLWIFGLESGASISRRGNVYTAVYVDEAAHIEGLNDIVGSVLGAATLKRDAMIVYATTPPERPNPGWHAIKARCMADGAYILRRTTEDPTIAPWQLAKLAKKLGGTDSAKWRREVLCEEVVDEDVTGFPEYAKARDARRMKLAPPMYHDRYAGLDLGFHPDLTVNLLAWYIPKCEAGDHGHVPGSPHCHVFSETVLKRYATSALAEALRLAEHAAGWAVKAPNGEWAETTAKPGILLRVGDMDGSKVTDLATDHGLVYSPTAKHNKGAQIARVNDWFRNGWLTIDSDLPMLDGTLLAAQRRVSEDGDATSEKWEWIRSKDYGHMDAADALIYLVRNIAVEHNPVPGDARGPGDYLMPPQNARKIDTGRLDRIFQPSKKTNQKAKWPDPRRLP